MAVHAQEDHPDLAAAAGPQRACRSGARRPCPPGAVRESAAAINSLPSSERISLSCTRPTTILIKKQDDPVQRAGAANCPAEKPL